MKHLKKSMAVVLALSMVLSTSGTPASAAKKGTKAKVQSVSIQKPDTATLVLKKNAKYQLKSKVTVKGSISKGVTYKSSNSKVVKVSSNGKLTAKKKGTAKITVVSKANLSKKAVLTVKVGTPVKTVKLSDTSLTGEAGTSKTLKVTVSPAKATVKKIAFTSSNAKVAKVSSKGKVSLLQKGTATITAKAQDGSGKKAVCKVTVTESDTPAGPTDTPVEPTDTPTEPAGTPTATPAEPTVTPAGPTNTPSWSVNTPVGPVNTPTATPSDIDYSKYKLKWSDEFDGDTLNRNDWNVELHEPGWVNAELQEYVDSNENIYLKDGKLEIKPIQTKNGDGTYSYTSGRITTQNKHDYTYGLFEARVKVPTGKGYLPAFWMMPTDENIYGQWPRCGEIDIAEVMGQETNKSYHTIHYGNPHNENQGTNILEKGSYADEYHTFAVEWLPGELIWYVDGKKTFSTKDWHSTTVGQGTVTYPAPFDQPFYVILNLAVGGSWVGYPDDAEFKSQNYSVDYVRVYQKDSYDDSDVKKPSKDVVLREPNANGNYVNNGDFAASEDLTDGKDWQFLTANDGEATAQISGNAIHINTTNAGTVDYSVQLVQPNLPMQKGATYKVSYDAYADEARKMMSKVSAPDNGWIVYGGGDIVNLTTTKETYSYEFRMTSDDDANGRLEFNMGAYGSMAGIHISNVKVEKIAYEPIVEGENKTILADGNFVYNGAFQEGEKHLGFWDITKNDGAEIFVTNESASDRRLKIVAPAGTSIDNPIIILQKKLALTDGNYAISFDADGEADKTIAINIAGIAKSMTLTGGKQVYSDKISLTDAEATDLVFTITAPGTYYLDNVRIVEDTLIKNGSFNAGFAGYEPYADGSASAAWVVDSISEDNAADFTINDTGDADWKIQLKQNNVELEKGQWYRLTLKAKSSMNRKFMYAIQRDGSKHDDDWTPYVQKTVNLTSEWETFVSEFQMTEDTDVESVLSLSMGAVGGVQITEQHRICIDDINLEKIEAQIPDVPSGENLLENADFTSGNDSWIEVIAEGGAATISYEDKKAVFDITNVGTKDYSVQFKQEGITLEKGSTYTMKFKATSTAARTIKMSLMSTSYAWYGGQDIELEAGTEKEVVCTFTMDHDTDAAAALFISMGLIEGKDTPASTITLSDVSLIKA